MKLLLSILILFYFQPAFARQIEVGKGRQVSSLKAAIKMAEAGDTILLHTGIYREGNIQVSKPIRLIGSGRPVLDGENRHEILTLTGSDILVRGIEFRNSGYSSMNDYASVSIVDGAHIIIEENTFINACFAIHIANARLCLVQNNIIKGNPKSEQTSGNGIHLWKCDSMLIKGNQVSGHRDGIYFEFVTHSSIETNRSENNIRYGLHFMFSNYDIYLENTFRDNGAGVAVMYSHHVLMLKNLFDRNWGANAYGLLLKEISDSKILSNLFLKNTVSVFMESTNRMDVQQNDFRQNGWALRVQASCNENNFLFNNFSSNSFDVATNGTMMLNTFLFNYWDKYKGYDLDRDGIGDKPFHPVSLYSMVIEQNPNSVLLLRSFMVNLLDEAEKAIPGLTPEDLTDAEPLMKPLPL
jgi:nitrous oxidase accessory protein